MAYPVSFRWSEDFVKRIDEARGLVPRSAFVREMVELGLCTRPHPAVLAGLAEDAAKSGTALAAISNALDPEPVERATRQYAETHLHTLKCPVKTCDWRGALPDKCPKHHQQAMVPIKR